MQDYKKLDSYETFSQGGMFSTKKGDLKKMKTWINTRETKREYPGWWGGKFLALQLYDRPKKQPVQTEARERNSPELKCPRGRRKKKSEINVFHYTERCISIVTQFGDDLRASI